MNDRIKQAAPASNEMRALVVDERAFPLKDFLSLSSSDPLIMKQKLSENTKLLRGVFRRKIK